MKKLSKITFQVIGGANVATILLMLLVGHADLIPPQSFPRLSNAGLLFPVMLIINFGFMLFWALVRPRGVVIPFLGFVVCYGPVRRYIPFNIKHDPPKDCIKVLSYNVWNYGAATDRGVPNKILEYIRRQDADIVCLQEASEVQVGAAQVDSLLSPLYQYKDTACTKGDWITLFSKFPVRAKEHIEYESKSNLSCAFTLSVNGHDVIVVNNHLETTGLTKDEKERFGEMVKGDLDGHAAASTSKWLVGHLGQQTRKRAPQAEAVARYISYHQGTPMIVCGDFNDTPLSYAHRVIGKGLTDCYVSTGNGPGISYNRSRIYVRIDNIMCTDDFEPYACKVDNTIDSSDHYPIMCWLKTNF